MNRRESFLPFAKPDIGADELALVTAVLQSGWLTTGPKTKQFEAEFAELVGAKHAIAINSATAAMHLALEASNIGPGDEVITTTYTFAATAEVIRYLDATPVLVDIDPVTFNIDTDAVTEAITEKTRAIIPVHMAGQAAALDPIWQCAKQHNLVVIEDAAHALPTYYNNELIGGLSDFTAFSFYATKPVSTGEGGMLTTNHDAWADRCRMMSLHGISRDAWKRFSAEGSWYYEIIAPGFKYNMTDLAAALGLAQLHKLDTMNARRVEIAHRYNAAFGEHPALEPPLPAPHSTHCYHLYMLRLNLDHLRIDRAAFIEELKALNIGTSVHYIPLHLHPYYRDKYGYQAQDFPIATREYGREISLPIYSAMHDDDVDYVIEAVCHIASSAMV